MKTIKNVTIYACDHCKKEYKRAKNCEKHEYLCWHNPKNFAKCFGCEFLTKRDGRIIIGGEYTTKKEMYFCKTKKTFLSPIQYEPYELEDEKNEPMPLSCKDFKEIDYENVPF